MFSCFSNCNKNSLNTRTTHTLTLCFLLVTGVSGIPIISDLLWSVSRVVLLKLESAWASPEGLIRPRLQWALPSFWFRLMWVRPDDLQVQQILRWCLSCWTKRTFSKPLGNTNLCLWADEIAIYWTFDQPPLPAVTELPVEKRYWPWQLMWKKKRILPFHLSITGSHIMCKGRRQRATSVARQVLCFTP